MSQLIYSLYTIQLHCIQDRWLLKQLWKRMHICKPPQHISAGKAVHLVCNTLIGVKFFISFDKNFGSRENLTQFRSCVPPLRFPSHVPLCYKHQRIESGNIVQMKSIHSKREPETALYSMLPFYSIPLRYRCDWKEVFLENSIPLLWIYASIPGEIAPPEL